MYNSTSMALRAYFALYSSFWDNLFICEMCRRLKQIMTVLLVDPVFPICLIILSLLQKYSEREIFLPFQNVLRKSFHFLVFLCWVQELSLNSVEKSHLLLSIPLLVGRDRLWTWFWCQKPRHRFSFQIGLSQTSSY